MNKSYLLSGTSWGCPKLRTPIMEINFRVSGFFSATGTTGQPPALTILYVVLNVLGS